MRKILRGKTQEHPTMAESKRDLWLRPDPDHHVHLSNVALASMTPDEAAFGDFNGPLPDLEDQTNEIGVTSEENEERNHEKS